MRIKERYETNGGRIRKEVLSKVAPVFWAAILSVMTASTQGLAQTPGQKLPPIRGGLIFDHPLEAVAESPTAAQEAGVLSVATASASVANLDAVIDALEAFVTENPTSVWTPSLQANLGRYHCTEGRWTKALEHWGQAWDATKQYNGGAGKRVADYTLAFWTRLLVELGRLDELQVIFAEAQGRVLDGGSLTQKYLRTREGYGILRQHPVAGYRCGWLVLNHLAIALRGRGLAPSEARDLYQESNLLQSCSMSALAQVALKELWLLVGVERPVGSQNLPLPSVMHLSQGHYVALLKLDGTFVLAYDPIFGVRRFRADVLNAETSGRFLVGASSAPAGWRKLSADEMVTTIGRSGGFSGGFTGFPDFEETDSDESGCGGTSVGGEGYLDPNLGRRHSGPIDYYVDPNLGHGGGGGGVSYLTGMPHWRVSEPNINLWLRDDPVSCQGADGPAVAFGLRFKQRDEEVPAATVFTFGAEWNSPWLSRAYYIQRYGFYNTTLCLPGGGTLAFSFPTGQTVATNYYYNIRLSVTASNDQATAFTLDCPDGRRYLYQYAWQVGQYYTLYLSSSVDAQGFVTHYNYVQPQDQYWGTLLRLDTVTDHQGDLLFGLQYTNSTYFSSLVSVVTNRFGRSAQLTYTEDPGGLPLLTAIKDAGGLTSTISYDDCGWPQTVATPYGSTTFAYDDGQSATYWRRWRISEPNGGSQTYLFNSLCSTLWSGGTWFPCELPGSLVPGGLPAGSTIDTNLQILNSFHWNQAQNTDVPTDLSQLTTNHMNKARMRHWLSREARDDLYSPDFAVSSEVSASQTGDGTSLGQISFYDYAGKTTGYNWARGTQIQPSLIARLLPDGSTWYTAYQRNSYGWQTSETSTYGPAGGVSTRTYSFTYAANDQDVVQRHGPSNELLATYAYNSRHQRTNEVLWPDSTTAYTNSWAFDQQGRLQGKATAAGQTTSSTYNGSSGSYSGYLSGTSEQPVQRTESFTWINGMVYAHTDYRGLIVTNFWDGLNRLTGKRYPDGTWTTNLYTRASAYAGGSGGLGILDLTATRDRLGHWTGFDYDPLRRIVARTNANGVVTRYGYCDCGSESSITNASGTPVQQVTLFTYDNQGNRITASYADGYSVTNWFNALAQTIASGDGTGYRWYFYNNQGLLTTVSNACGLEKDVTFDIRDRPQYVTDANGVTVVNAYDNLGRLLARGYPDNGVEGFGYSAQGVVAYTNQIGLSNFFAYDAAARKTFETNANGHVIRYTNSAAGDLLSLTDGKNQTTRWTYDEYGRVTNKVDQARTEILRYKYDAESRLTNRWSAAKGNTAYAYDFVGNLTNINYPASPDVTLQYNWLNRLTNMVDAAGTTKYTYTAGNQLLTEDGPFTSDTVTNTYVNRLRTALSLQQPAGLWTNKFVYDAAGRLTNVTSPAGSHGYMLGGSGAASPLIKKLLLPNTSYITNTYGAVARLTGTFLNNSGNTTLDSSKYGYNAANQRTTFTNAAATYVGYTYDRIGQLKVADSSVNAEDCGYTYDTAWNLNYLTNNGVSSTFTVDSRNQLSSTPLGSASYDSNGNLVSYVHHYMSGSTTRTCAYDDENRLVSAYSGTVYRTDFGYDGLGRMRTRTNFTWGGSIWVASATVEYIYDGMRVIQERDGSNLPTVSYTRGTDLSGSLEGAGGIGGLLARSSGYSSGNWTDHNFYHADGNGNIMYLVNSSQALAAAYRYDPFGNLIGSSGSLAAANVYRFSSKEIHFVDNNGSPPLYYYGYRFYDPSLQRWLTRDPIGEEGGIAVYQYVGNNPVILVDPFGLLGWKDYINPLNWFSPEFWGEVLHSAAMSRNPQPIDPNSNRALLNEQGLTPGVLMDDNGSQISAGQATAMVGGAVVAGALTALTDGLGDAGKAAKCGKLSKGARRTLGNLTELADKTVAEAIRLRGGGGQNIAKLETGMGQRLVRDIAEEAAGGDSAAMEAIKMIKQAARKGQRNY